MLFLHPSSALVGKKEEGALKIQAQKTPLLLDVLSFPVSASEMMFFCFPLFNTAMPECKNQDFGYLSRALALNVVIPSEPSTSCKHHTV